MTFRIFERWIRGEVQTLPAAPQIPPVSCVDLTQRFLFLVGAKRFCLYPVEPISYSFVVMMRSVLIGLLIFCATGAFADNAKTWAFTPGRDVFSPAALLDLSSLNETTAGESGFVRRSSDGASFVRGDGEPIRFWAVNTSVARKGLPALREHAKFLAKRGVNMVRFHGQIPQAGKNGGSIDAINTDERRRLWQLVSAMRDEGIYTTFSPYYPHAVRKEATQRWVAPQDSDGLAGLIYFDPIVQAAYKNWLKETLVAVNPYTGIALKDDPALAIIQMQNEDSLLFWSLNNLKGREARLIAERFGAFLERKYKTLDLAREAFDGAQAPGPIDDFKDDWETGSIALANLWHLTEAANTKRASTRLRDQTEFLTETMRSWHAEIARFLREDIGATQLFNAGNWKTADSALLDDLERYSYTTGDIVATNRYVGRLHVGQYRGWAIVEGDRFREEGVLRDPLDMPITVRQPAGFPYILPETLWIPPTWQQSEAPVLMAAYQSLTGVDISYWFGSNAIQWRQPQSGNGYLPSIGKWVVNTPQMMGAFPAAALIFRNGLIDEGPPLIIEYRPEKELWSREIPLTAGRQGRDPNRNSIVDKLSSAVGVNQSAKQAVSPYAFLAGPVLTEFGSDKADFIHPDINQLLDEEAGRVTSITRQLTWDWSNGVVSVNAPKAQGVVGNLSSKNRFQLEHVSVQSEAQYASVLVVSMDGKPVNHSGKLLVQLGSIARPTDWEAKEVDHEGEPALEVVAYGSAPWQITPVDAVLAIDNSVVSRATKLDANGMALEELHLSTNDGVVSFRTPRNALYVILE